MVEQSNISNLDIGAMWWKHVQAFDNLLYETLTIKLIIGQNTFKNLIFFKNMGRELAKIWL
jgi:hypothetical protein